MSYYDVVYKGVPCRFEIGGDWNRKFWELSSHKECAQAVIPVWTICEEIMKYLVSLPGTSCSPDRSIRVIVDKKTVIVAYASNTKMQGFWLTCEGRELVYTWAKGQLTFIHATDSQWVTWVMNHYVELESALLVSDADEDSLDKIPDDPRYLIRVGRKVKEIEDGEMDHITLKEIL